jgi:2,4-dienoyl-CoA reductase-like NADH-dependent reductase (Old Yellow Enzyme family)
VRALIVASPSGAVVGGAAAVLTHAARPIYIKNLASFIAHAGFALAARPTELSGTRHAPCDALRCAPRTLWQLARSAGTDAAAPGGAGGAADTFAPLPLCAAWALALLLWALDAVLCGRSRAARALGHLTPAALLHARRSRASASTPWDAAYRALRFTPPFAWPDRVAADIARKRSERTSSTRRVARGAARAPSRVFAPLALRGVVLKNRLVKAATYEAGCAHDGVPRRELVDFHGAVAAGNAALTTIAYASVSRDGRSFATQLLVNERAAPRLAELAARVAAHGGHAAIQLTHAGYFADRAVVGTRQISASCVFNPAGMDWPRRMGEAEMARVVADFCAAARIVQHCGISAVQLHLGHGYLLAQYLSPFTNRRRDRYGGSITNRLRFPLRVVRAVRAAIGEAMPLIVKMNLTDGFRGGITLEDAAKVAQAVERCGCDLIVPSGGWISRNGFYMLRGAVPLWKMQRALKCGVKRVALLLFGKLFVPTLPWRPSFFARDAKRLLPHLRTARLCLIGGVSSLDEIRDAVDRDGFACVAMARAFLREPDFARRMEREARRRELALAHADPSAAGGGARGADAAPSRCSHCNECIVGSTMAETFLQCVELF